MKIHHLVEKYLRTDRMPHLACPGCGIGQIIHYNLMAIDELQLDPHKVVFQTGVGCSSRLTYALWKGDNVDATHGRALPQATGLKLARPELTLIVLTGDGDCLSIGGNHFIHACRRNIPLVVIMVNNMIYGMTGGQVAPTTPIGYETMTTPYGNIEEPLDGCRLAVASGATYVARWTSSQPRQIVDSIKRGICKNGLAYIEIVAQCPTMYGRYVAKIGDPITLLRWIQQRTISIERAEKLSAEELRDKFIVGEFLDTERPSLVDRYRELFLRHGVLPQEWG